MKKMRLKELYNAIQVTFLVIVLCLSSSIIQAHQTYLSFDSLFPATWYQKALESSLSVWQHLADLIQPHNATKKISFDEILGKLVFAQFCLNRMKQEENAFVSEDKDYLVLVLNKIKSLMDVIGVMEEEEDFVVCVQEMIVNLQKQLVEFKN